MYVDLELVAADSSPAVQERQQDEAGGDRAYLGVDMTRTNYGSATIDDLEFWFGERSKLIELDFLLRGTNVPVCVTLHQFCIRFTTYTCKVFCYR